MEISRIKLKRKLKFREERNFQICERFFLVKYGIVKYGIDRDGQYFIYNFMDLVLVCFR